MCFDGGAVEGFDCDVTCFVGGVGFGVSAFGEADGAGVEAGDAIFIRSSEEVGMAVKEDCIFRDGGEGIGRVFMTVGEEKGEACFAVVYQSGIGEDGEAENHLIDLGIAVSADTDQLVRHRVQKVDDLFGGIALGEIVSGAMIEDIAQDQDLLRALALCGIKHRLTADGIAVNVGCDQ